MCVELMLAFLNPCVVTVVFYFCHPQVDVVEDGKVFDEQECRDSPICFRSECAYWVSSCDSSSFCQDFVGGGDDPAEGAFCHVAVSRSVVGCYRCGL